MLPERSAWSIISAVKKDREILFISKRDAVTTDEIYTMKTDGSDLKSIFKTF